MHASGDSGLRAGRRKPLTIRLTSVRGSGAPLPDLGPRESTRGCGVSEVLARLIEKHVGHSFEFGSYHVSRSSTHLESLEIFRFRFEVYREAGYVEADDFSEPLLTDEFDDAATQIAVRNENGGLVGATRFVPPSPLGFHTERIFDLDLPPIDPLRMAEFGRLAVRSNHRGGERLVMLAMLKAVFECMIDHGTTHVLAYLSPKLADSIALLGCKPLPMIARAPSARTIANRSLMKGYFASQHPIPVLYDLEAMLAEVGVSRVAIESRLCQARCELPSEQPLNASRKDGLESSLSRSPSASPDRRGGA